MNFKVLEIEEPKTDIYAHSAKEVYEYLKQYSRADREIFLALYFTAKNRLIEAVPLFAGTVDCSAIYPREVVKVAVSLNASSVVLAHNHPSGECDPSTADKTITKTIQMCCYLFDIKVLDHVIIGKDCYYSFADSGVTDDNEIAIRNHYQGMGLQ